MNIKTWPLKKFLNAVDLCQKLVNEKNNDPISSTLKGGSKHVMELQHFFAQLPSSLKTIYKEQFETLQDHLFWRYINFINAQPFKNQEIPFKELREVFLNLTPLKQKEHAYEFIHCANKVRDYAELKANTLLDKYEESHPNEVDHTLARLNKLGNEHLKRITLNDPLLWFALSKNQVVLTQELAKDLLILHESYLKDLGIRTAIEQKKVYHHLNSQGIELYFNIQLSDEEKKIVTKIEPLLYFYNKRAENQRAKKHYKAALTSRLADERRKNPPQKQENPSWNDFLCNPIKNKLFAVKKGQTKNCVSVS